MLLRRLGDSEPVLNLNPWYNYTVPNKPLIETNLYLRDPEKYEKLLVLNVGSSTAIELGGLPAAIAQALKTVRVTPAVKSKNGR